MTVIHSFLSPVPFASCFATTPSVLFLVHNTSLIRLQEPALVLDEPTMNDPGVENVISTADDAVQGTLRMQDEVPHERQESGMRENKKSRRQYSQDKEEKSLYQPTYVLNIVVTHF
jgi:hypothetical protein